MKWDELDARMRVFETLNDQCVLPGIYMVARIDGRSFTRLTKEVHAFESPYDVRFRDMMVATAEHVMNVGFRVIYAYTQSDEISLLFHRDEDAFNRKTRKYNSVLAGEATAAFVLQLGALAAFDCRICELPNEGLVRDYFRWRNEDAVRNALNGHCYWALRRAGADADGAGKRLIGMSVADKNELLFQHGMNFNHDVPAWQKRGIGLYWETYDKPALNPKTGASVTTTRRRVKRDFELPMRDAYGAFVQQFIDEAGAATRP